MVGTASSQQRSIADRLELKSKLQPSVAWLATTAFTVSVWLPERLATGGLGGFCALYVHRSGTRRVVRYGTVSRWEVWHQSKKHLRASLCWLGTLPVPLSSPSIEWLKVILFFLLLCVWHVRCVKCRGVRRKQEGNDAKCTASSRFPPLCLCFCHRHPSHTASPSTLLKQATPFLLPSFACPLPPFPETKAGEEITG